jgi:hypothetical protein
VTSLASREIAEQARLARLLDAGGFFLWRDALPALVSAGRHQAALAGFPDDGILLSTVLDTARGQSFAHLNQTRLVVPAAQFLDELGEVIHMLRRRDRLGRRLGLLLARFAAGSESDAGNLLAAGESGQFGSFGLRQCGGMVVAMDDDFAFIGKLFDCLAEHFLCFEAGWEGAVNVAGQHIAA